jgi:hypothetical protein
MERKIGKYRIEADAYILKWSWNLLPAIGFAFDEVGVYFSFGFLCLHTHIQIEDEVKEQEWNDHIGAKFAALTDTEEDEGEDDNQQFSLN